MTQSSGSRPGVQSRWQSGAAASIGVVRGAWGSAATSPPCGWLCGHMTLGTQPGWGWLPHLPPGTCSPYRTQLGAQLSLGRRPLSPSGCQGAPCSSVSPKCPPGWTSYREGSPSLGDGRGEPCAPSWRLMSWESSPGSLLFLLVRRPLLTTQGWPVGSNLGSPGGPAWAWHWNWGPDWRGRGGQRTGLPALSASPPQSAPNRSPPQGGTGWPAPRRPQATPSSTKTPEVTALLPDGLSGSQL